MHMPVDFKFKCKSLETQDKLLGEGARAAIWSLSGTKSNSMQSFSSTSDLESEIHFRDPGYITDKLLTEIRFKTLLGNVSDLKITRIFISLAWDAKESIEKRRNQIFVTAHGRHSIMQWEPSEFKFDLYSNQQMNYLIHDLLLSGIGEMP